VPALEFPIDGIDDGVVGLRLHADSDLEAAVEASLDPEVLRWTRVPDENSLGLMREWLTQWRSGAEELHLLVVGAQDAALLGAIGIVDMDRDQGRCGIGYWLAKEARGRGVMVRAVRLLCAWIFETLPIERIEIQVEPDNAPSHAVAERAGFSFEGILRSHMLIKGRRRDAASYSLLRGELPQQVRRHGSGAHAG